MEKMIIYKSAIAWELVIPFIILLGGLTVWMLLEDIRPGFIIMLLSDIFIIYIFSSIKYVVTGETLDVKCGFIFHRRIEIKDILRIVETKSLLSVPAASFDRLMITGKSGSTIISPKAKTGFISKLKALNPNIETQ